MERFPGFLVDLSLECSFERGIMVGRAQEVGMSREETLLVVIGVDEPEGDPPRAVAAYLTFTRMEKIRAIDLNLYLVVSNPIPDAQKRISGRQKYPPHQDPLWLRSMVFHPAKTYPFSYVSVPCPSPLEMPEGCGPYTF